MNFWCRLDHIVKLVDDWLLAFNCLKLSISYDIVIITMDLMCEWDLLNVIFHSILIFVFFFSFFIMLDQYIIIAANSAEQGAEFVVMENNRLGEILPVKIRFAGSSQSTWVLEVLLKLRLGLSDGLYHWGRSLRIKVVILFHRNEVITQAIWRCSFSWIFTISVILLMIIESVPATSH